MSRKRECDCPDAAILLQFENPRWPELGWPRVGWLTLGFTVVDSAEGQLAEWEAVLTRGGVAYIRDPGASHITPLHYQSSAGFWARIIRVGIRMGGNAGLHLPWPFVVGRQRGQSARRWAPQQGPADARERSAPLGFLGALAAPTPEQDLDRRVMMGAHGPTDQGKS